MGPLRRVGACGGVSLVVSFEAIEFVCLLLVAMLLVGLRDPVGWWVCQEVSMGESLALERDV
jgi:hypothetical protein